ncbi:MAG: aspartate--tRNA(Asn) ligase [Candidatus Paceibacterota bacterium]|jgi:aspartyl-tRNA synthetase
MNRTLTQYIPALIGQQVKVAGFSQVIRDQKKMQFVILRDQTGQVQICHEKGGDEDELKKTISSLTAESAVTVIGRVVENKGVKLGGVEIVAESIDVSSIAIVPLPITPESSLDLQMDWRMLSLRQPENLLIFQVQTTMEQAMREFWADNGFIEVHSPKLMATASESGAELFQLEYFGQKATLAQSPQFYKQMAMAAGFDRIFEIAPVFRANPSFTSRHDTEFTSVDMEISWVDSHEDLMHIEETWLHHVVKRVSEKHGKAIKDTFGADVVIPQLPFPRVTLANAREILAKQGHTMEQITDLDPPGERGLAEHIKKEFGHEFVFVIDYPIDVRPFYHMRHVGNPGITKSFDLLWKGLEVTTGAQREHRVETLEQQAREKGLALAPLAHYINFFRYGCPPHGGFGVGLTRLLMVLLDRKNVREVTYLYRGPNRLTP